MDKIDTTQIFEQRIRTLPLLPLRNLVALPKMAIHLDIGRKISEAALEAALAGERYIFLVTQKNLLDNEPQPEGLYQMGTVAKIQQIMKLPNNETRVSMECLCRAQMMAIPIKRGKYYTVTVNLIEETPVPIANDRKTEAFAREAQAAFSELSGYTDSITPDHIMAAMSISDLGFLADYIAQNLFLKYPDKQGLLEKVDPYQRIEELLFVLNREVEIADLEADVANRTRERIGKSQRDFYIREQIRILQEEIGEDESSEGEAEQYREAIRKAAMPDDVKKKLFKEADRLSRMPSGSQESNVSRTYLDTCLDLPWGKFSNTKIQVDRARKILNTDHYGLKEIKERILETFAVLQNMPKYNGQILCLVGPPGTGKTSVAQSIARAMGRKFVRVSLGGVHDEAEIRGHRRTYIASMPGKIINAVIEAGTANPVLLLDEVDKVGNDYKGDPAAALLEVLDPEQNKTFRDHFLDIPFDLSQVFFILTANVTDTIPRPLLDRMEIIELTSYTQEEKVHIAIDHLLPKQRKKHGLTKRQMRIDEKTLNDLIRSYTREAGVRALERTIASLCRKTTKYLAEHSTEKSLTISPSNLESFLGPRKYRDDLLSKKDQVGVVTGLAYTAVGGEVMPIEVCVLDGTGKIELTGSLGDVMKESARAAISYIRSQVQALNIDGNFYKTKDIHIHIPEGAVPKDGPSAGITMATAIISQLTGIPVRHTIAMTGEITLRGRVLPIGGLKEKTMAAYKAGIRTVILPQQNLPDLKEIDETVRQHLTFLPVERMNQVLSYALTSDPLDGNQTMQLPLTSTAGNRIGLCQ